MKRVMSLYLDSKELIESEAPHMMHEHLTHPYQYTLSLLQDAQFVQPVGVFFSPSLHLFFVLQWMWVQDWRFRGVQLSLCALIGPLCGTQCAPRSECGSVCLHTANFLLLTQWDAAQM